MSRGALACAFVVVLAAGSVAGTTPDGAPAGEHDATAHHAFDDVEHWVSVFDDPARDEWQKPAFVVERLGVRAGMRVADLGAGTGYFSRYLSRAVAASGTVYAVDTEPKLVAYSATVRSASTRTTSCPCSHPPPPRACRHTASTSC